MSVYGINGFKCFLKTTCELGSMDWFKGKFEPETLDSPIKHGAFRLKFSFQSIDGMHIQVTMRETPQVQLQTSTEEREHYYLWQRLFRVVRAWKN